MIMYILSIRILLSCSVIASPPPILLVFKSQRSVHFEVGLYRNAIFIQYLHSLEGILWQSGLGVQLYCIRI